MGFLSYVAGITNHTIVASRSAGYAMPVGNHFQNDMVFEFRIGDGVLQAIVTFVDSRFWRYQLNQLNGTVSKEGHSSDFYLNRLTSVIDRYSTYFNFSRDIDFAQAVSTALSDNVTTVDRSAGVLNVSYDANGTTPLRHLRSQWLRKIGGEFTTLAYSVQISLSSDGVLTELTDNMRLCKVADVEVQVSEQEAIETARSLIDAYAAEHQQRTASVTARLGYVSDIASSRGDAFTLYPQWQVTATYDRVNEESVNGYCVMVWADNGQVYHHDPQGYYGLASATLPPSALAISVFATVFIVILGLNIIAQRRSKSRARQR
jgi:hypothetical protein